jgi:protein TonB
VISDRSLTLAVGASLCVHALALGLGGGMRAPAIEAPRLLEARLVQEAPPERVPERPRVEPPPQQPKPHKATPAEPHPAPRAVARPEPAVPQQRLVAEAASDHPAPAIATAPAPAPASSHAPVAVAPAAPVAAQASSAASYTPPSFGARYLDNPKPAYPMIARRRGLEGIVRLDVRVSPEGIPVAVKVRESGGHESLDEAAVTAVWHWRFVPARRSGEPVEASVVVPIRFRLGGDDAG